MSEYLVRWKFAANSLINRLDRETTWYMQFHSEKSKALDHYISLLKSQTETLGMTVEFLKLTKLVPGKSESIVDGNDEIKNEMKPRNIEDEIFYLFQRGFNRKAISEKVTMPYAKVCKIVNKHSVSSTERR